MISSYRCTFIFNLLLNLELVQLLFRVFFKQNEMIHYDLSINEGTMHSEATFYFKSVANKTHLIWVDSGDVGYNPIFRFMLPSKIKSTEAGFEEGLFEIKRAAEKRELE